MADDLRLSEVAVLVALMAEAREVSNVDLKARYGFTLTGESKRRLNDRKLVATRRGKRGALLHQLDEEGWVRCRAELTAPCPPRAGTAGGALYALLRGLHRYVERTGLSLAELFGPGTNSEPTTDVEAAIRGAYAAAPHMAAGGVTLANLRPLLARIPRQVVDEALVRMGRQPGISLLPKENHKALTDADHDAAVQIGPIAYHYFLIEGGA